MSRESKKRRRREDAQREQLLAPDAFEAQGATWTGWLQKNLKLVLAGLGGVLVLIVVLEVVRTQGQSTSAEHTEQLMEAADTYQGAVSLEAIVTSTSAELEQRRYTEAQSKLQGLVTDDAPESIRQLAGLFHADLARRAGELKRAVEGYDSFLASAGPDDALRYFAEEGRGYALEADGQLDEALGAFRKVEAMDRYRDFGLKHVARILRKKGDVEGARDAYEQIVARVPESPLKDFAEQQMATLD